jgi:S-formylglutathione hydrolase
MELRPLRSFGLFNRSSNFRRAARLLLLACVTLALPAFAADKGSVERIKVHGRSLEGNLSGDSPVRDVAVYLPASYAAALDRHYPVVYMLHGFTDSVAKWFSKAHWITLPDVLDRSVARADTQEVIVVMPDAFTRFQGSFYSNSVVTGNWERFVSEELVAYVDSHYRTIAKRESRGLAGHSMGGYGTMRIGAKRPDVFAAIYLLSPCCMQPRVVPTGAPDGPPAWESIRTDEDFAKAGFGTKAVIATAAVWAPNPKNPPFYFDMPTKNGVPQPTVAARIASNAPLAFLDQHIDDLRSLNGIALDAGDADRSIAASIRILDERLNDYAIPHDFEIYEGNHISGVATRIETKVMPFFSEKLSFE